MKQTALKWLEDNLIGNPFNEKDFEHNRNLFRRAKEMEKVQILFAYGDGQQNGREFQGALTNGHDYNVITSEQYYKKTYE